MVSLTPVEYQEWASSKSGRVSGWDEGLSIYHGFMGFFGEAGEVTDLLKKHFVFGQDMRRAELKKEMGDFLWYLSEMYTISGENLPEDFFSPPLLEGSDTKCDVLFFAEAVGTAMQFSTAYFLGMGNRRHLANALSVVASSFKTMVHSLGFKLGDVALANVEKLDARYATAWTRTESEGRADELR